MRVLSKKVVNLSAGLAAVMLAIIAIIVAAPSVLSTGFSVHERKISSKDLLLKKNATPAPTAKNATAKGAAAGGLATTLEPISVAAQPSWSRDYSQAPNGPADPNAWVYEHGNNGGWGNGEAQSYTSNPNNVRVEDGNLVIEARKDAGAYTSARLTSQGKLDFTYGRLEIVAKLPIGQGIWPALWLWPTDDNYSKQPAALADDDWGWLANGEIDMFEGSAWGDSDFTASAHSMNFHPGHNVRTGKVTVANSSGKYHTYSLDWSPTSLQFAVDGKVFKTVTNTGGGFKDWPYNQRYHLIMNVAMGGSMSSGLISPSMPLGINDAGAPWQMKIRSINYYPLAN